MFLRGNPGNNPFPNGCILILEQQITLVYNGVPLDEVRELQWHPP